MHSVNLTTSNKKVRLVCFNQLNNFQYSIFPSYIIGTIKAQNYISQIMKISLTSVELILNLFCQQYSSWNLIKFKDTCFFLGIYGNILMTPQPHPFLARCIYLERNSKSYVPFILRLIILKVGLSGIYHQWSFNPKRLVFVVLYYDSIDYLIVCFEYQCNTMPAFSKPA